MTPPATSYRYHVFLSYRHLEPDRAFTLDLLRKLEGAGFKVAIDERDFRPHATLPEEMERCIRESHFTLAILTPRYLESGNTLEEAIITTVLDMGERQRRLIPLILEPVQRPAWIHGIVGVDFAASHPLVDPHERLLSELRDGVERGLEVRAAQPPAAPAQSAAPAPVVRPARKRPRLNEESLIALLEEGIAGIPEARHSETVLQAIRDSLPMGPDNLKPLGLSAWALDYFPGRSDLPGEREAARTLREDLLAPLRERRPPPPPPEPSDSDWAEIPEGSFEMGAPEKEKDLSGERPVHRVTLSPFRLLVHPVTNGEYRMLDAQKAGNDDLPVVEVDWYSAYSYAAWLGGRLPTEAEWEYAARAGRQHAYCDRFGAPTTLDRVGWYLGNSERQLHPVERLEMNPWGLFDMVGNVWEWVGDWYGPYSADRQSDPWGPTSGERRVLRGGSF